jgi:type IV secretion system protein VirB10
MSAPGEPAAKLPPEALEIRGRPRPVARLSRKALVALLGVSATLVLGGTLWALRPPAKKTAGQELYSTDRRALAEGLDALPKDYGAIGASTGTGPGVPRLGPPLPGDLGRPILNAMESGRLAPEDVPALGAPSKADALAADQARQQAVKSAQDAIGSGLFSASDTRAGTTAIVGSAVGGDAAALIQTPPQSGSGGGVLTAAPAGGSGAASLSRHEAFASLAGDQTTVSAHSLEPPPSPYAVMAGTTIEAALVTGLDSDLPGQIIASVTKPVFDTVTGRILLIPQGARLLGTYDSQTAMGETRAMVVWTRLILPDSRSIVLDRLPGTDAQGLAGVTDQVDNHWGRVIGGAALSSLLDVGAELAAPQEDISTSGGGQIVIATRNGVQDTINQVGQELTRRNLDLKPTIKVRPGTELELGHRAASGP